MMGRWGKGILRALMVTGLVAAAMAVAQPAQAYRLLGYRWESPGEIHYNYVAGNVEDQVPNWMAPYVDGGAERWSQTQTPLVVTRGSGDVWIHSYEANDGFGGTALCDHTEQVGGVTYCRHATISINLQARSAGTTRANWHVVLHEFGHVFGLDHSPVKNAVMFGTPYGVPDCREQGGNCPTQPREDDVSGINAQYNYHWDGSNDGGCDAALQVLVGMTAATKAGKYSDVSHNAGSAMAGGLATSTDAFKAYAQRTLSGEPSANDTC